MAVGYGQSTVLALDETLRATCSRFTGCAKFEDTNPLESPVASEFKWFCPAVGLVRDVDAEGFIELASYTIHGVVASATAQQISAADTGENDGREVLDD